MTLGQAQTGTVSSTPKICRINGDDKLKVIYRNLGNNHAYPFMWSDTVTLVSGTEVVVASGVKFHGYDLATYGTVVANPLATPGAERWWVEKDTGANVIKIKSTGTLVDVDFDIIFMLGAAAGSERWIEGLYCRGNQGNTPSLP
jgi:hypothetical protein